ncbi:MAG: sodium:solute symporter [Flavobacteriia bacterium]|nr:sodium:solute symporter [Flavobacteriia bacterium]
MEALALVGLLLLYFGILFWISRATAKNATTASFFSGDKKSPWYLVAFGMIGTSLSGVTFISVPGKVLSSGWHYYQLVLGFFLGYFVVAFVLLPIYYRLQLTSIYTYLEKRLGISAYRWGAGYFILSRCLGATVRLYLVINVLQLFIFDKIGIPFALSTLIILTMIVAYTLKGGVKTIVWTDTLQTSFMLLALVVCVICFQQKLGIGWGSIFESIHSENLFNLLESNPLKGDYFWKHLLGGAFISIAMTGLDQEMMQKNISVKTLRDAQKNMMVFSVSLLLVNALFLLLGSVLTLYAAKSGISVAPDDLFPLLVQDYLPFGVFVIFIIGLISALFPSVDGAITALTASFCLDILGFDRRTYNEETKNRIKRSVHLGFAFIFMLLVFTFKWLDNKSIVDLIFDIASYTYGPLLGLFAFGILTKRVFVTPKVVYLTLLSPVLCYLLKLNAPLLLGSYQIGNEMLIINGALTLILLLLFSKKQIYAASHQP